VRDGQRVEVARSRPRSSCCRAVWSLVAGLEVLRVPVPPGRMANFWVVPPLIWMLMVFAAGDADDVAPLGFSATWPNGVRGLTARRRVLDAGDDVRRCCGSRAPTAAWWCRCSHWRGSARRRRWTATLVTFTVALSLWVPGRPQLAAERLAFISRSSTGPKLSGRVHAVLGGSQKSWTRRLVCRSSCSWKPVALSARLG